MKRVLALALVAALSACGGGGGAGTPPPTTTQSGPTKLALTFQFKTRTGALRAAGQRKPNYVSYSTQGLGIDVVPSLNDTTLPKSTEAAMQSPAMATTIAAGYVGPNTTCTAAVAGAYSCTLLIVAPAGYDDIQITTWDAVPGSGPAYFSGANNLSTTFLSNQQALMGQTNSKSFTLDGVVASVALQVTPTQLVAGAQTPVTGTLSVFAKDADGNYIIADPYADANGNPLTVTIAKNETYPAPVVGPTPPANGDVTFSLSATCTTVTSCSYTQAGGADTINYNGGDISSVTFSATTNSTLDAFIPEAPASIAFTQSTNGGVGIPGPPAITEYSASAGAVPIAVTSAGDGNVWFTDNANAEVGVATPGTGAITEFPITSPAGASNPVWIASGSDNAVWYTTSVGATAFYIGRINTATHAMTSYAVPTANANLQGLALGPDGNLWFTEYNANKIGCITPAGAVSEYSNLTALASPFIITAGSDGNMWFSENGLGQVASISTGSLGSCPIGPVVTEYGAGAGISGTAPVGITSGPDGNIWFTEINGSNDLVVAKMVLGTHTVTEYATTQGAPSDRTYLTSGSDGNLWITNFDAASISRIAPTGVGFTSYASGISAGEVGVGLAGGPDGNIWFADKNAKIGKVVP